MSNTGLDKQTQRQVSQARDSIRTNGVGSSVTPVFVFLGAALGLWSIGAMLSSYLATDFSRNHHGKAAEQASTSAPAIALGPELEALRKKIETTPDDPELRVQLGYSLFQTAHDKKDSSLLMEAVQHLGHALKLDPNHKEALRAMSALTLQAGVLDKALEFYPRYLSLEPGDMRARSDFALALIEAKKYEEADKELAVVLEADPKSTAALMTLAYSLRSQGKLDLAKLKAEEAKSSVTDSRDASGIDAFIQSLSEPALSEPAASGSSDSGSEASVSRKPLDGEATLNGSRISPANLVSDYFNKHEIVGPKVRGIKWVSANLVEIKLDNFPVENMPPFARTQFLNKVKEHFSSLPEGLEIKLLDASDSRELLSMSVGKSE